MESKNKAIDRLKNRKFTEGLSLLSVENNLFSPRTASPLSDLGSPNGINLSAKDTDFFTAKITRLVKKLEKMRENIVNKGEDLCEIIKNLQKKSVNEVLECEFELKAFCVRVEQKLSVDGEMAKMIKKFKIVESPGFLDFEKAKDGITQAFEVNSSIKSLSRSQLNKPRRKSGEVKVKQPLLSPNSNPKLICAKDYTSGLFSINLINFHLTPLAYFPKIYPYYNTCKISPSKYFLNGGYDGQHSVGSTYLLDCSNNTYKNLPNSIARDGSGTVYVKGRVYVFGGLHTKSEDLQLSQCFDLEHNVWTDIAPLPRPSNANTASFVDDCILISGYHLDGIYLTDTESYISLLKLPENSFKYIFEKWVFDGKTIYELEDLSNNLWSSFASDKKLNLGWLYCFTSSRYNQFIYFLDDINGLMRINTVEKKLEVIGKV